MNSVEFEKLCRDASVQLELEDTAALGLGRSVSVHDVAFEAAHSDGGDSFMLLADLGTIAHDDRVSVYNSLLTTQPDASSVPRIRFGFHPMHEAVLCVGAGLDGTTDGAWLAALLESVSSQFAQWRGNQRAATVTHPSEQPRAWRRCHGQDIIRATVPRHEP